MAQTRARPWVDHPMLQKHNIRQRFQFLLLSLYGFHLAFCTEKYLTSFKGIADSLQDLLKNNLNVPTLPDRLVLTNLLNNITTQLMLMAIAKKGETRKEAFYRNIYETGNVLVHLGNALYDAHSNYETSSHVTTSSELKEQQKGTKKTVEMTPLPSKPQGSVEVLLFSPGFQQMMAATRRKMGSPVKIAPDSKKMALSPPPVRGGKKLRLVLTPKAKGTPAKRKNENVEDVSLPSLLQPSIPLTPPKASPKKKSPKKKSPKKENIVVNQCFTEKELEAFIQAMHHIPIENLPKLKDKCTHLFFRYPRQMGLSAFVFVLALGSAMETGLDWAQKRILNQPDDFDNGFYGFKDSRVWVPTALLMIALMLFLQKACGIVYSKENEYDREARESSNSSMEDEEQSGALTFEYHRM